MNAPQVLAVDDSPVVHELLDVRLGSEGIVLHHELDALRAFDRAVALQPDLILLDVEMPHLSGFRLCQQLTNDPRTQASPIIFVSAETDRKAKVRGLDLGAVDYVTKPFDFEELGARVRAALRMKRYHDLLATRAQLDALTGLWNRAHLDRRLDEELAAVRRYGRRLSLVMMDVDHFKQINDGHGHPFGDRVLARAGELLLQLLRSTDVPCRYGGEEFALLLPETRGDDAVFVAERVRLALRESPLVHRGAPVAVTASFGVASVEDLDDGPSGAALLAAADEALYFAKRTGRDKVIRAR